MSGILKEEKGQDEQERREEGPQSSKAFGCYPLGQRDVLATYAAMTNPDTDKDTNRDTDTQPHHGGEGMAEMPCEGRGTWWRHLRRMASDHNLQGLPLATCLCSEALYPKCSTDSLNSTTQASKHKNPWKEFYIQIITGACND